MRTLLIAIAALFSTTAGAQLVTSTAMNPAQLVQNVLLGSGVTVSNITFNGAPMAIGYFDATNTTLGIDEGILLTTGTVQNTIDGPHGPNDAPNAGMDNGAGGFPPLTNLIGGTPTFNASILEFDFVPYSDSVRFNYVFASEEYPEYVGSQFNDVFAFFISGPGITGLQNMATLPSGQAVAINNVNNGPANSGPCTNCAYYVDNGNGSNAPYNANPQYIQYDGYTTVLTAESEVECGQTYHLVISIADAGDPVWDSGIFIEANSLSSNTPVEMTYQLSQELFMNNNQMAEGCVTTTITIERGANEIASPMTIPVNVSGTATEGVDYDNLPNSITFPAGVQTVTFDFTAFADGITEGQESVVITLPLIDPCGNPSPLEITIFIEDVQPVEVEITGANILCPGDMVNLNANITGGVEPYTILWNTNETTEQITVSPNATETYSVSVTDVCLNQTATDDFTVTVPNLPPLVLTTSPNITEICPYLTTTLDASASGGSGSYSYQWSSPGNQNLGTSTSISVTPASTTTYTVTATDNCGDTTSEDIVYTITSPPLILTMSPTVEICPGDSVFITVTPSGGFGQYYYNWLHSGENSQGVWVTPDESSVYTVSVSDECQTFTVEGATSVRVVRPTADFELTSNGYLFNNQSIQFVNTSINAEDYEWDFGNGSNSTIVHPQTEYDDAGIYYITLVAIDDKGCTDTIVKPINIEEEWYIYVPNTFTPDGNRHNNDFRASTVGISDLNITIFNRWGEIVFFEENVDFIWDGTYDGWYVPDGTYTYKIEFVTNSGRNKTILGHVNMLR
jgi:gliding motility-associated-like protein